MTVGEAMERIDPIEFLHWKAIHKIEPFGYDIDNLRAFTMPALFANQNRKKDADIITPADFYPHREPKDRLTPRQRRQLEAKRSGKPRS